jgi:hypothetical protein
MKRFILLSLCAWPLAAGAQSDNQWTLANDTENLIPIATMAGAAWQCGIRSNAWEIDVIDSLRVTVINDAAKIWSSYGEVEAEALFNAGTAIESAVLDGMHITPAQCQTLPTDPGSEYLTEADAAADGYARNKSGWKGD